VLLIILYLRKKAETETRLEADPATKRSASHRPAEENSNARAYISPKTMAAHTEVDSEAPLTAETFRSLIDNTRMDSSLHLTVSVQKLRAQNSQAVANLFLQELHSIGQNQTTARSRLVFLANALQTPELLPFWNDLALRTTPLFANEAVLLHAEEPSLASMSIANEMTMAIRNIGVISIQKPEAEASLIQIIENGNPDIHDDFVRERAFLALKETDLNASLRVMKQLKADDDAYSQCAG
jgi:hypothetical protein